MEQGYALIVASQLQETFGDRIRIQLDLVSHRMVQEQRQRFYADDSASAEHNLLLSELVSPLIVEPDGTAVPLEYGFSRCYALGNIREASLRELGKHWREHGYHAFRQLCCRVHSAIGHDSAVPLTNWYSTLREASLAPSHFQL